jgi:N-acylglucosamine-6-phosphate 2-epimerase
VTAIPARCLVVSCQARADNPLHGPDYMAALARAAEQGGAAAIRANGAEDIAAIRAATSLPIIGILKRWDEASPA